MVIAPAAEARARASCGSKAWAGAGAASVTRPTTISMTATTGTQEACRSMPPSIDQRDFGPAANSAAALRLGALEDRDWIDRRARHILQTERRHGQQELPAAPAGCGAGQLLEVGVVDEPEAH